MEQRLSDMDGRLIYVGKVLNYLPRKRVAIILIEQNSIAIGDHIRICSPPTRKKRSDFEQEVKSLQINHKSIRRAGMGMVAMKVEQPVREGDMVFLITNITNR